MDISILEDLLCDDAVEEICTSSSNDEAVKKWTQFYLYEMGQLNICPFACQKMVEGYDFTTQPENMIEWIERAIWVSAWNVYERRGDDE